MSASSSPDAGLDRLHFGLASFAILLQPLDQGRALGQRGDLRVAPGDHPRLLLACGLALVQPGAELARQRRGPVPLLGQPSVVRLQLSRPVLDRRVRRLAVGRLHFQVRKPNSKLLCFRGDLAEPRLQARPVAGHLIAVLLGPTRGTAEDRPDLLPDRVPSRDIGQSLARSPAPGRDAYREVEGLGGEQDVRVIQRIDQRGPMAVKLGLDEILDRRRDGGLIERIPTGRGTVRAATPPRDASGSDPRRR